MMRQSSEPFERDWKRACTHPLSRCGDYLPAYPICLVMHYLATD